MSRATSIPALMLNVNAKERRRVLEHRCFGMN